MKISREIETDVLVVGGGLAAVKAALESAASGLKAVLAVKTRVCSGSSFYPLMGALGCQAPTEDPEDPALFLEEIREAGYGMQDDDLNRVYIDEIRDRVKELPEMGIAYKKMEGRRIACFAKRPRDIFIWRDWDTIRGNVYAKFEEEQNVTLLENYSIIHLLKENGRIAGAVGIDGEGSLVHFSAKAVILCTGGYGDLYKHSLNTPDVSGDGQIMALESGAELINMEFIQFIPGLTSPRYKLLFSEQILTYCGGAGDKEGKDLLSPYLPGDVSLRECLDQRGKHGPFTSADSSKYFDIAMMKEIIKTGDETGFFLRFSPELFKDTREFMTMYIQWLKNDFAIDLEKDIISIAPFAHAANGGIRIDKDGSTRVPGLFAAGEAAGGIHGADRHGGNASGSCFVFGKRAADGAASYIRGLKPAGGARFGEISGDALFGALEEQYDRGKVSDREPEEVLERVKEIMWYRGNVLRNRDDLTRGLKDIAALREEYNPRAFFSSPGDLKKAVKADHSLKLAGVLLEVMLRREESRGAHYREDHPERNDEHFLKRIVVSRDARGKYSFGFDSP